MGDLISGGFFSFFKKQASFLNSEFETKRRSNCVRTLPIRDERSALHYTTELEVNLANQISIED